MERQIYERLKQLEISYQKKEHRPIYTVADAKEYRTDFPGLKVKNLLLKEKKSGRLYLAVLEDEKRLEMKALGRLMTGKATFAGDSELFESMGLFPGAVTPLALIHEDAKDITVIIDYLLVTSDDGQMVNFHPGVNTATLSISCGDFRRYLESCGNATVEEDFSGQYFLKS